MCYVLCGVCCVLCAHLPPASRNAPNMKLALFDTLASVRAIAGCLCEELHSNGVTTATSHMNTSGNRSVGRSLCVCRHLHIGAGLAQRRADLQPNVWGVVFGNAKWSHVCVLPTIIAIKFFEICLAKVFYG